MHYYILATNKPWNVETFVSWRDKLDGSWNICISPEDLEIASMGKRPRFVFFPHWSHIVPDAYLEAHECVCFHMTDVPYGRGGSPLQNLIARGHEETVLTALRMTPEIDAGPVYLKRSLRLDGTAEEIFRRAADLSMAMIQDIIKMEIEPSPQQGEPTVFKRRKPAQSRVPEVADLRGLFDHIRMLDAPGYPHAFIDYGDWTAQITDAKLDSDAVEARIRFQPSKREDK